MQQKADATTVAGIQGQLTQIEQTVQRKADINSVTRIQGQLAEVGQTMQRKADPSRTTLRTISEFPWVSHRPSISFW